MHNMPTLSITGIKWPIIAPMTTVVIGDDWQFSFTAMGASSPINLVGYTVHALLDIPNAATLDISYMVDSTRLFAGVFTLTVLRSLTATLLPYECGYKIKAGLIDPSGFKSTLVIVRLEVQET